ncbi:MAG: hypothetical protein ACKVOS_00165 [Sphingorhabdus sp.]|uniref:hypothetical protein n=1 Tax=Sphingorhabdus sp. TaxID=1902408 RepID=UPI0038FC81B7
MTPLFARSGSEFLVNTATFDNQNQPTITSLASGGFVVSWFDASGQGGDADVGGIKAQIFDATGAKLGAEFLVNTSTFGTQQQPTITSLASGGFVVSWFDASGQGGDASGSSIKAQIFDAAGVKSGGEFLVNTATLNEQSGPTITSLASGGFVVSWNDRSGQGGAELGSYDVKAQIFTAAGVKSGGEFLVNTITTGAQEQPTITSLALGGFVVSWIDVSGQGGDASGTSIKAQIFDAAGVKSGGEFLVNTATLGEQFQPTITSLASGGFVVSWGDVSGSGQGGDASGTSIKAQIFDAAGVKSGSEFLVNTATLNNQQQPTITSLASGGFVVSWIDVSGQGGDASGTSIKAQIFDAAGAKSGSEFLVNTATFNNQQEPTITSLASGGFVVSWTDSSGQGGDASSNSIKAQIFNVVQENTAPTINSNGSGATASLSIAENETIVTTVVATDPDIAAAIVYSLSGGDDVALFTIDAATGVLAFASAPNFEAPADVGGDNVYNVIVRASDGTLFDEQAIAVTVLNDASEIFTGTTGNDTIVGTGDDDILTGLAGNDILNGAGGNDTASYAGAAGSARVSLALATSQNIGVDGRDTLISIENLIGSNFNDVLTGNAVANILDGGAGNDTLIGGAGNDSLLGGLGNDRLDGGLEIDTLDGGAGNDTYTVNETGDVVIEGVNAGTDLVNASASFTLTANVEKLTLTGVGDFDGTGNDLANTLIGNAGNNVLTGGAGKDTIKGQAGNDRIIGGLGADFLTGGTGSDTFVFDSLGTTLDRDTIKDFVSNDDTIEIMRSAFGAFAEDALGVLDASAFTIGTKATTVDHHLIYNAGTGALFYDADGSGLGAQVQIALFSTKPTLGVTDFLLI